MAESDDLREFIRELLLRFDRRMHALDEKVAEEHRITREENRVYFEELRAETAEIIAESKAQRAGFLRMLDRLDSLEGGGTAPAG